MAEYAGYVAPTTVDYGALSSGLLSNRLAVEKLKKSEASDALKLLQKQQAADEKARIQKRKEDTEDDKLIREDIKNLGAAEYIPDKSYNTFVTEATGVVKDKIFELNKLKKSGEITNEQYLIAYNSIKDDFTNQFVGASKTFNSNLQELTTSVAKGDQSEIGAGLVGMFADGGQIGNKKIGIKEIGGVPRLQQYTIDKDGNVIEDETITNIGAMKNKALYSDLAVDYNKKFEDAEKAVGQVKIERGSTTIESKKQNEKYNSTLEQQIQGIIPSDLDKARLLANQKGYKVYFTQQQKDALLNGGKKEEELLKFALNDKGAYSPYLTDAQKKEAYDYTKGAIEGRMSYSKTLDEPVKVTVNVPKPTQSDKDVQKTLNSARGDWESIVAKGSASPAIARIKRIYNNIYRDYGVEVSYTTAPRTNKITGVDVYPLDKDGNRETRAVDRIGGEQDLFRIYTPKSRAGQEYSDYDDAVGRYGNQ